MSTLRSQSKLARLLQVLLTTLLVAGLTWGEVGWAQGRPPLPGRQPVPTKSAPATQPEPMARKVQVDLMVVYANNESNKVDPSLEPVMQQLRFTPFKSFTLLQNQTSSLEVGEEANFSIAGGRRIKIELLSRDEKQAKIRLRMFTGGEKKLDTTVSIWRNRSFMVAGPHHQEGRLVLPITVRY